MAQLLPGSDISPIRHDLASLFTGTNLRNTLGESVTLRFLPGTTTLVSEGVSPSLQDPELGLGGTGNYRVKYNGFIEVRDAWKSSNSFTAPSFGGGESAANEFKLDFQNARFTSIELQYEVQGAEGPGAEAPGATPTGNRWLTALSIGSTASRDKTEPALATGVQRVAYEITEDDFWRLRSALDSLDTGERIVASVQKLPSEAVRSNLYNDTTKPTVFTSSSMLAQFDVTNVNWRSLEVSQESGRDLTPQEVSAITRSDLESARLYITFALEDASAVPPTPAPALTIKALDEFSSENSRADSYRILQDPVKAGLGSTFAYKLPFNLSVETGVDPNSGASPIPLPLRDTTNREFINELLSKVEGLTPRNFDVLSSVMSAVYNWNFPNDSGARPYLFGDDFILGTRDDDVIYGFSGNDTIRGYSGNDILRGMHGRDQLAGGSGDDVLVFDGSTSAFDTLSLRWASVGPEQASGGPGKDFFVFRPTEINLTPTNDLYQLFDLPSLSGNYDKDKFLGNYRYKLLPEQDYNEQKSIWAVNKSGTVVQFTYTYNGNAASDKYLTAVHDQAFDEGHASIVFGAQTLAFRDDSANLLTQFSVVPTLTPASITNYSGISSTFSGTGGIGVPGGGVIPVSGVGTNIVSSLPPANWISSFYVPATPNSAISVRASDSVVAPDSITSSQITVPFQVTSGTLLAATNITTMDGNIPTGAGVRIWVRSDQIIAASALEVRFYSGDASTLTNTTVPLDIYPLPSISKDLWTSVTLQGNWFAGDAKSFALFAKGDVSTTANTSTNIFVDRLELFDSALGDNQYRVLRAYESDDANLSLTYDPVIGVNTQTRKLENSKTIDLFDRPRGSDGFPYGREFYDGGGDSGPDGFVGPSGLQQWSYQTKDGVYIRVKDDNQYYNPFLSQNQNREPFSSQDPNRVSALTERIRITDFQVGSDKIDLSAYGITNEFLQSNNLFYGGPLVGNLYSPSLTSFPLVSQMKLTGTAYLAALSGVLSTKEGLTITAGRTPWTGGALSLFIKENNTATGDYNKNGQLNDTLVEIQLVGLSLGSVSARMFGEAGQVFGLDN
jgi:hypothetical protein